MQTEQCLSYILKHYPKVKYARACRLINCSRKNKYYSKQMPLKDALIKSAIERVINGSRKGRKKVIHLVRKSHPELGASKIRRVYEQEGFALMKRPKKRIRSGGKNQAVVPLCANEEWAIDFMHDSLVDGRKLRSFNVIDPYNCECKGIFIRHNFPAKQVIEHLERLIEKHGKPRFIRSDNGPEFISKLFQWWLKQNDIGWNNIERGKPVQNCFVERFNRTAREDFFDANLFYTLEQANELAGKFQYEYNHIRPHESIDNKTPIEYAA